MSNNLTVAKTILQQMGGAGMLKATTGANTFSGTENSLSFHFKICRKANLCRVTLNGLDLYDVEFFKSSPRKGQCLKAETISNIYFDQLTRAFENFTGLYIKF